MNSQKTYYYFALAIFATAVIGSIINSVINYEEIILVFNKLGYPPYLIQILGVAQTFGLILILINKSHWSLEWVYAGFFINYSLGTIAHLIIKDGNGASAVVCLILLFITYILGKRIREPQEENVLTQKPNFT